MCKRCEREIDSAKQNLSELITEYELVRQATEARGVRATDMDHLLCLTGILNKNVQEHHGVINGQLAAVAIHQIVTGTVKGAIDLTDDQIVLATMMANEQLPEAQRVSVDAAHRLLEAVAALQRSSP